MEKNALKENKASNKNFSATHKMTSEDMTYFYNYRAYGWRKRTTTWQYNTDTDTLEAVDSSARRKRELTDNQTTEGTPPTGQVDTYVSNSTVDIFPPGYEETLVATSTSPSTDETENYDRTEAEEFSECS